MLYKETEKRGMPTIIILHGGGLSWWSLRPIINQLKDTYHVITPVIDGHGEDGNETFISIENSAQKLIKYIDHKFNGKVFAIAGLSIGAQIATEILSLREDITDYAIVESALIYPIKGNTLLTITTYKICYGLIKKKWFSKLQAIMLNLPEDMFEQYYSDSLRISRQSLINLALSNGNYILNKSITDTKAKVLIIVGEKEIPIIIKSGNRLHDAIADSELYIVPNMGHGEISLRHPEKYVKLVRKFLDQEVINI